MLMFLYWFGWHGVGGGGGVGGRYMDIYMDVWQWICTLLYKMCVGINLKFGMCDVRGSPSPRKTPILLILCPCYFL